MPGGGLHLGGKVIVAEYSTVVGVALEQWR
jgi:hypothetical protein